MYRSLLIPSALSLLLMSCQDDGITGPFDYHRDTPDWMKAKIDSISSIPNNVGTRVLRYEWRGEFIFYIEVPISSCAYCELYDQEGAKIQFTVPGTFEDFLLNKQNEIIVWEWPRACAPFWILGCMALRSPPETVSLLTTV